MNLDTIRKLLRTHDRAKLVAQQAEAEAKLRDVRLAFALGDASSPDLEKAETAVRDLRVRLDAVRQAEREQASLRAAEERKAKLAELEKLRAELQDFGGVVSPAVDRVVASVFDIEAQADRMREALREHALRVHQAEALAAELGEELRAPRHWHEGSLVGLVNRALGQKAKERGMALQDLRGWVMAERP